MLGNRRLRIAGFKAFFLLPEIRAVGIKPYCLLDETQSLVFVAKLKVHFGKRVDRSGVVRDQSDSLFGVDQGFVEFATAADGEPGKLVVQLSAVGIVLAQLGILGEELGEHGVRLLGLAEPRQLGNYVDR